MRYLTIALTLAVLLTAAAAVSTGEALDSDAQNLVSRGTSRYEALIALRSSSGFQAALNAANTQLSINPRDSTAAGVRALVYANAVDFLGMSNGQARKVKQQSLAQARELSESNPWTRAAYGLTHMFDNPALAERELRTCIKTDPGFLECYNILGDLLRKAGQLREAKEIYRLALQRWPSDGELLVSDALRLQQEGQVESALEVLKSLTRAQPEFARGHWHLAGMLYESGGDKAMALREARTALSLDPHIWNGRTFLKLLDDGSTPIPSPEQRRRR